MDHTEKILRLQTLIGENAMKELDEIIKNVLKENPQMDKKELNKQYVFPKIRQHGLQVQIKKRLLRTIQFQKDGQKKIYTFNHHLKNTLFKSIEKKIKNKKPEFEVDEHCTEIIEYLYSRNALVDIEHYSVWVNKKIYHWGPSNIWVMYGESETNREITNEWEIDSEFDHLAFTLRTSNEIEKFCDNFKTIPFDIETRSSKTFKNELLAFLDPDY